MNLIKLEDPNVIPLEEIMRKLDNKYKKLMAESEIIKIGEGFNVEEFESNLVNNVIPKPKEFDEASRRNTHFMRPRYILKE